MFIVDMGHGELASNGIKQSLGGTNISTVIPDDSTVRGDLLQVCVEAEGSTCEEEITNV